MITEELLAYLVERDVKLWVEGDRLRYRASKDALAPEMLSELSARKAEIVQFLRDTADVAQPTAVSIQPAARDQPLPLSFGQQRLWFLHQFEPQSIAYNIPTALRLEGRLDLAALRQSIAAIAARHEVLRTTFAMVAGQPVQLIAPPTPAALPLIDLQYLPLDQHEPIAQALALADVRRPFALHCGPLLWLQLVRLAPETHVLALVLHHSIADGWSLNVLVRELVALYRARLTNQPVELPRLTIQYADYAVWQRERLQGTLLEAQLAYWRRQLAGLTTMQLLTDHPRPAGPSFVSGHQSIRLGQPLTAALEVISRRAGVTLFIVVLAAFQVLLQRYTGQDDIVVGTPIAGRTQAQTEPLIGFFVNTLVLRTDLRGSPTFLALLTRVKAVALNAYEHQELPFERLVEVLHPERDMSRNPFFQVMFALQNMPVETFALPGLTVHQLPIDPGVTQFDLNLLLTPTPNGLVGELHYRADLFDVVTLTRMLQHFTNILAAVAENPQRCLADLALLSAEEQQQLQLWNATTVAYPADRCIDHLVAAQAARTPDAVAVVLAEQHLSYAELDRRSNQLAQHLLSLQVGPATRVGLCLARSLELVVGLLATLKAGAAYVPLDPAYPTERLAFMIDAAAVSLLITDSIYDLRLTIDDLEEAQTSIVNRKSKIVNLRADWPLIARASSAAPPARGQVDALLYLIYTSGSTGTPKAAGVYQRGFLNLLHWFVSSFAIGADDRMLLLASFSFDLTQKDLFAPLLTGGQLHLLAADHYDAALIRRTIQMRRISWLNCTPSAFYPLVEPASPASVAALGSLRAVFLGGEPIATARLHEWVMAVGTQAQVVNTYGPTECTDVVASYALVQQADWQAATVPIGRAVANTHLLILDRQLALVPLGVAGELCIGGAGVGLGYLNDPALTAERFVPNPWGSGVRGQGSGGAERASDPRPPIPASWTRLYRTGDLARRLPDGRIVYLGRIDGQVKLRGYRVELGEIESRLGQHPAVRAAVVIVRADASDQQRLIAYIVPHQGSGIREQGSGDPVPDLLLPDPRPLIPELRVFLKERLPEYMIPSAFVVLDALPLTPNGKVNLRALPDPDSERADLASHYQPPCSMLERRLVELWEAVLDRAPVGVHDDFFALGGDSIRAAVLANRLQQLLDTLIYVVAVFDAPTVAALAGYLEQRYPAAVARLTGTPNPAVDALAVADVLPQINEELIATMQQMVDATLPPKPAPLMHRNPSAVFILSAPRSGSTLLRVMLAGHPRLFAPPELALLPYATLTDRAAAFAGRDQGWLEGLLRAVMELHECDLDQARRIVATAEQQQQTVPAFYHQLQLWLRERVLVDKTTTYASSLRTLQRAEAIFAQARYIHLVRHPAAMIHSYLDSRLDQVFGHDLPFPMREKAELFWLINNRNIQTFFQTIPAERQLTLHFEELVTQPREVVAEVCDFLGLAFEPAMLEPYQGARMTDAVRPESRMVGDPRFHQHQGIEAEMAWKWQTLAPGDRLSAPTLALARSLGYDQAPAEISVISDRLRQRRGRASQVSG